MRIGWVIAGVFATLTLATPLFYAEVLRLRDDPGHAARVFTEIAPNAEVLASRRWHPRGTFGDWACTFAIVRLPSDVSASPVPDWAPSGRGGWLPTPAPALGDTTREAIGSCAGDWSPDLAQEIAGTLAAPGAWISRDGVGERVKIWGGPGRLAASVRYGD